MTSAVLTDTPPPATSYDEVPYESYPFPQTHPDRLATVATLANLSPQPIDACRVLELGCAAGGNLLPMAVRFPSSHFVGIDLSRRQIGDGLKAVEALGLSNIELKHLSITDVDESFGQFDYIICHGVYSWVPDAVQDQILAICRRNLAPQGVAYVSYNTYPGWHMRGMIRDMMYYHAGRFREPNQKVRQARALLDFLAESVPRKDGPYGRMLKEELEQLRNKADHYLLHEHLEEFNQPLYFHQFIQRAEAHGLRYLAEAQLASMAANDFPAAVQQTLRRVAPDPIQREQYMDFLRNRMFRMTLLCHRELVPNYRVSPDIMNRFHLAAGVKPSAPALDVHSTTTDEFMGPHQSRLTTAEPVMKAAMLELGARWPKAVAFPELVRATRDRLGRPAEDAEGALRDTRRLATGLLNCYTVSILLEMYTQPPEFVLEVSDRPIACPLARYQAAQGGIVASRRHEVVRLSEAERHTLRHLDGQHDRETLKGILTELMRQGVLVAKHNGEPVYETRKVWEVLNNTLNQILPKLAQHGLLIG